MADPHFTGDVHLTLSSKWERRRLDAPRTREPSLSLALGVEAQARSRKRCCRLLSALLGGSRTAFSGCVQASDELARRNGSPR